MAVSPVIGAIIGYFTNWLAIKMLFRPHHEKRILGRRLPFTPGLIPKERFTLSKKIGETATNYVLTEEVLESSIQIDREKIIAIADEIFMNLKNSEKTLGDIIGTENIDKIILDFLRNHISDQLIENICNFASEKISLFLEDSENLQKIMSSIKNAAVSKVGKLSGFIEEILSKNPEFDKALNQLVSKTLSESYSGFGKVMGVFVNYDKIYENIKKNILDYLADEGNQIIIAEKADILIEKLLELKPDFDINNILFEKTKNDILPSLLNKFEYELPILKQKLFDIKISQLIVVFLPIWKKIEMSSIEIIGTAIEKGGRYILRNIAFGELIEEKINSFNVGEAEAIILSVVKRELNMITWLGALLGFIIGLLPIIMQLMQS